MKATPAVQINRDPFARATLVRHRYIGPDQSCRWCGQDGRFCYGWEEDQRPGRYDTTGPFCSVGCYRDYHA